MEEEELIKYGTFTNTWKQVGFLKEFPEKTWKIVRQKNKKY